MSKEVMSPDYKYKASILRYKNLWPQSDIADVKRFDVKEVDSVDG